MEKTFSSENSSEFCTHRPTRARLPPFADASLTAPDLLTRDDVEHSNVGGSGGRRRGPRRSSSHPALYSLFGMFTLVLAPQSTHPPLSKKGFQHSKIFSIFLKLSPEYYYPLHEVLSYTAAAFFSFVHDTILSFEKKSIASQATQNI